VGVYIHRALGVTVSDASVEDSLVQDNDLGIVLSGVVRGSVARNRVRGHRGKAKSGIALGDDTTDVTVAANQLEDNFRGIISAGAKNVTIHENSVVGTGPLSTLGAGEDGDGIVCRGLKSLLAEACVVTGNTVRRSAGSGIVAQLVSKVRLIDNTIEEVGQRGIHLRSATNSLVSGNHVTNIGLEAPGHYDGIELTHSANFNVIASNTCRLGGGLRNAIGIGPGCIGNQVESNTVLP
jgi:parallel beta-helix repeat protein